MRFALFVCSFFIALPVFSGPLYDVAFRSTEGEPSQKVANFIECYLSREAINVAECMEVVSDIHEYLTINIGHTDVTLIAMFLVFKQEAKVFLDLLHQQYHLDLTGKPSADIVDNSKCLLRVLLPYFANNQFTLNSCLNTDETLEARLLEAFDVWKFSKKHSGKPQCVFTEMRWQVFSKFIKAFINETEELKSLYARNVPFIIFEDRLRRLSFLLKTELKSLNNYQLYYELTAKLLCRQIGDFARLNVGKKDYAGQNFIEIMNAIAALLSKILVEGKGAGI